MRTIEEKIIITINHDKSCKLSSRDIVERVPHVGMVYSLHGTRLFVESCHTGKRAIFLSSIGGDDNPISVTTKSRLNAFLSSCNMPKIQQKNFELFCNGEKLKVDCWYLLDCGNQKLIRMESFVDLHK